MQDFVNWVGQIDSRKLIIILILIYWVWTFLLELNRKKQVTDRLKRWDEIKQEQKEATAEVEANYVNKFSMSARKSVDDNIYIDYKFKAGKQEHRERVKATILPKEFHPERTRKVFYKNSDPSINLFEVEVEHKDELIKKAEKIFKIDLIVAFVLGVLAIILVFMFF